MVTGEELKMHALHFHSLGLNVSCISHIKNQFNFLSTDVLKAPISDLSHLETVRQDFNELNNFDWNSCTGIGLKLGYESLMAIDIDGCVSMDFVFFLCEILKLPKNYSWIFRSGSGCGFQVVFYCRTEQLETIKQKNKHLFDSESDDIEFGNLEVNSYYINKVLNSNFISTQYLKNKMDHYPLLIKKDEEYCYSNEIEWLRPCLKLLISADKIEFKWKGHSVIPPSLHRSGLNYSFLNSVPLVAPVNVNIEDVYILHKILCSTNAINSSQYYVNKYVESDTIETKYIVLSTETNGLPAHDLNDISAKSTELLQLAWICFDQNNQAIRRKLFSIKPYGIELNTDALKYHGLSFEKLNVIGEDVKTVLYSFLEDIKKCEFIVCHNVDFALNVIKSELIRNGMDVEWFDKKKRFCTMKSDYSISLMNKNGITDKKYPKLIDLFNVLYKSKLVPLHSAMHNVVITYNCYLKVKDHSDTYIRNKDEDIDTEHTLNTKNIDDFIDPFDDTFYRTDDLPF